MSHLLAMSFDTPASPSIRLRPWEQTGDGAAPTGWGFAWYPGDNLSAQVVKDPISSGDTALTQVLRDWERFRAVNFVCHIRGAAKRVTQQDTHPFTRSFAGRDWVLAHNGDLRRGYRDALPLGNHPLFEPVGRTDSEWLLCWLLSEMYESDARRLADMNWSTLHGILRRICQLGTANLLLCDGQDLIAFRDESGFSTLHVTRRIPPHQDVVLENAAVTLSLEDPFDHNNAMVLVATRPLADGWREMQPGEMLVARRGAILWTSHPEGSSPILAPLPTTTGQHTQGQTQIQAQSSTPQVEATPQTTAPDPGRTPAPRIQAPSGIIGKVPRPLATRVLRVTHETRYSYEQPVERSSHLFRLRPRHDVTQDLLEHTLTMTPFTPGHSFQDVFGNHTIAVDIDAPYTELTLVAESLVRVVQPRPLSSKHRRSTIPLVWMPWQRQMMNPYLLPVELPETQLRELSDYAMSFVERQDYGLIETLDDINRTIYSDFSYMSGSTTVETTPFDVYVSRRGVCQDFANLFICIARLLGVPARYRVGYIHTGADYENTIQSEASHAWAEVYLPQVGWRGYDPTNGCLTGMDHIGVAVGRNYRDATPTQGTLFKGGSRETLTANVRVDAVDEG